MVLSLKIIFARQLALQISTAAVNRNNMVRLGASGENFNGTPTYIGGADPITYAGYALAAGSQGKGAASDGVDVVSA